MFKKFLFILIIFHAIVFAGCDLENILPPSGNSINGYELYLDGKQLEYERIGDKIFLTSIETVSIIEEDLPKPKNYTAYILDINDVTDGDTIKNVSILIHKFEEPSDPDPNPWPSVKYREDGIYIVVDVRLYGIDAPEMRTPSVERGWEEDRKARERSRAEASRDYLQNLILNSTVDGRSLSFKMTNHGLDPHGRTLADVYCYHDGIEIDVVEKLIEEQHAIPYDPDDPVLKYLYFRDIDYPTSPQIFDWSAEDLDLEFKRLEKFLEHGKSKSECFVKLIEAWEAEEELKFGCLDALIGDDAEVSEGDTSENEN